MEVNLAANQETQLRKLASETGREIDDLIQEAVARLLDEDEWFRGQLQVAFDQFERGEFIEHEEVEARLSRTLTRDSDS